MRLVVILIGLAIATLGAAFYWGRHITKGLDQMYARLPGKFQYPAGLHQVVGGAMILFGVLIMLLGAIAPRLQ